MAFKMKGPPYKSALKHKVDGVWHTNMKSQEIGPYNTDNTEAWQSEQGSKSEIEGGKKGGGKRYGRHSHKSKVKSEEQRNPNVTRYD